MNYFTHNQLQPRSCILACTLQCNYKLKTDFAKTKLLTTQWSFYSDVERARLAESCERLCRFALILTSIQTQQTEMIITFAVVASDKRDKRANILKNK